MKLLHCFLLFFLPCKSALTSDNSRFKIVQWALLASALMFVREISFSINDMVIRSQATSVSCSSFDLGTGACMGSRVAEIDRADEEGVFCEQVK